MRKFKKSFYEWCIENNKQIYLDNWNYDKNGNPKNYSYTCSNKIFLKCPRGLHDDSCKIIRNIIRPNTNPDYCDICNSFGQWCLDNDKYVLLKLWDYDLNNCSPFDIGTYSNNSYYFKCSRKLHESHKHVIYSISKGANNAICRKCNSVGQLGIDKYDDDFFSKYWSSKNTKSAYDIQIGSKQKFWLTCQICGDEYLIRADHFAKGVRHKGCSLKNGKSKLQKKVENYISILYDKYTLLHENNCTIVPKSPINNYNMYYDNEIKELKLIIEVHGLQHYKTTSWDKMNAEKQNITQEEVFKKRLFYDEYKMNYAIEHGYSYLIIPYWTENDDSYKQLIDEKILQIA